MRILHVVHGLPADPGGGTERYVVALAAAQAERGHAVTILAGTVQNAPATVAKEAAGAVRIVRYHGLPTRQRHWSEFADPIADDVIRRLLAEQRPDLVHVHHWMRLTSRLVALAAAAGVPAVVTLHDTWAVCPRTFRLKGDLSYCDAPYRPDLCLTCAPRHPWQTDEEIAALLAERHAQVTDELALAQRIVVPSAAHQRFMAQTTGLPAERFLVLPHPTLASLAPAPAGAGAPDRPLRIGCLGAFVPHKGQDVLLQALPLLPPIPGWEAHLYGREEIPPFAARLRTLAEGLPVHFHGGYEPEALRAADLDVVVIPSLAPESFSFTLEEALQLGLPVVVTDRGALAERAGEAALVVPAGDPEALAEALRRVLDDPALRARLRAAARAHGAEPLPRHVLRLETLYAAVAGPAAPPPALDEAALARLRYRQVLERDARLQELEGLRQAREEEVEALRQARDQAVVALTLYTEGRPGTLVRLLRELWRLRRVSREQAGEVGRLLRRCLLPPTRVDHQYQAWLAVHAPDVRRLDRWRDAARRLAYRPLISVVTPVHDVEERWLVRAIESVRGQAYEHWELCLVNDGASLPHVAPTLAAFATRDPRIRVAAHPENRGIAAASQTGLAMAAGEFVAFLDHDDELAPHALAAVVARLNAEPETDLLYSDEDKVDARGRRFQPAFKPDWSPDLLRSMNYLGHLCVVRAALARKVGGFRPGFDGSQDYDLLLRLSEATPRIAHVPDVLYSWRTVSGSAAGSLTAKPYAYAAAARALQESLDRQGVAGHVERAAPGRYTVRYRLQGAPLVSVIVPVRAGGRLLQRCLATLQRKTAYPRYEVLIVETGSGPPAGDAAGGEAAGRCRVLRYDGPVNAAALVNFGAAAARGDYLLLIHDDTEVVSPEWMAALLEHAQRPEIGAVGGRLLYPDGRLQHAGLFLRDLPTDVAGYRFRGLPAGKPGYLGLPGVIANVSAVSAACLMVPRRHFEALGGFDEAFREGLGDIDFCLRVRGEGRLVVYTPVATLYHHEAAPEGRSRPVADQHVFRRRWPAFFDGRRDPYWNPNLSVEREGFELAL